MPRSVKAVKRSRVKQTHRNKKNAGRRNKLKLKKKLGRPGAANVLHSAWDDRKSIRQNLKNAGLVFNPNEIIPLPNAREPEAMDLDAIANIGSVKKQKPKKAKGLAKKIEEQAKEETKKQSERAPHRLRETDLQFCSRMVEKHGLNFEAMARDHENIYQHTAKQIERKVVQFKKSKAYKVAAGESMES